MRNMISLDSEIVFFSPTVFYQVAEMRLETEIFNPCVDGIEAAYLSVETESNRLVPQRHEEITSVHLVLQVTDHRVH